MDNHSSHYAFVVSNEQSQICVSIPHTASSIASYPAAWTFVSLLTLAVILTAEQEKCWINTSSPINVVFSLTQRLLLYRLKSQPLYSSYCANTVTEHKTLLNYWAPPCGKQHNCQYITIVSKRHVYEPLKLNL